MLENKRILITGGTGSLGQALVKELIPQNPLGIKIYSNEEWALADMRVRYPDLRYIFGDIRDREMLWRAMNKIDYVIHTAALKRIEICEENPEGAINTNILGTNNVIDIAIKRGVDKVLGISSDKAVHPINLYGATKLVGEKLFINANTHGPTKFSCIRFGNFEGSRGSVIPTIEKQIAEGKPITITNKEMTRFWITLENAAKFTLDCLERMDGGEIFIPKMTERDIMELMKVIAPDSSVEIIGTRPGEKLHELLFAEGEEAIDCETYYLIKPKR